MFISCILLGEIVEQAEVNDLKVISEKLEIINLQLALSRTARRKKFLVFFSLLAASVIAVWGFLLIYGSPYLGWDYSAPERAVVGVLLHAFEWFCKAISDCSCGGNPGALLGMEKSVRRVTKLESQHRSHSGLRWLSTFGSMSIVGVEPK